MSNSTTPDVGHIVWTDLTVPDAEGLKEFYREVVGWESSPVSMGAYEDFNMNAPGTGDPVAGVCHARGANANLPPVWLVYVTVEDVDRSAARCRELGGRVLDGPRGMGKNRFCVIADPAGAVIALIR